jgi:BASS family bile acid:Na+ symporter
MTQKERIQVRLLQYLGRRAALVMALGVFIGLALPQLAAVAKPLLAPTVICMLTLAMTRTDASSLGQTSRRFGTHLVAIAWLLVATPCLFYLVLTWLEVPSDLAVPLLIWSGSPPLVTVPVIALIIGLDAAAALFLMVICTFAFPFILPGLLFWLIGIEVDLGAGALTLRLALMIAGCAIAATVLRRKLGPTFLREKSAIIDGVAVLLMLIFAVSVMDGVRDWLERDPGTVLLYTAAAFAASIALQVAGGLLFFWTGRQNQLSVALCSGNRNMALFMAAAGPALGPEAFLFFAVVQFPIYILPALQKPIYRYFSGRRLASQAGKTHL